MENDYKTMNLIEIIASNIQNSLEEKNISPAKFGQIFGYSPLEVHRILSGEVILPPFELQKIATFLETTKENLIKQNKK